MNALRLCFNFSWISSSHQIIDFSQSSAPVESLHIHVAILKCQGRDVLRNQLDFEFPSTARISALVNTLTHYKWVGSRSEKSKNKKKWKISSLKAWILREFSKNQLKSIFVHFVVTVFAECTRPYAQFRKINFFAIFLQKLTRKIGIFRKLLKFKKINKFPDVFWKVPASTIRWKSQNLVTTWSHSRWPKLICAFMISPSRRLKTFIFWSSDLELDFSRKKRKSIDNWLIFENEWFFGFI